MWYTTSFIEKDNAKSFTEMEKCHSQIVKFLYVYTSSRVGQGVLEGGSASANLNMFLI